MWVFKLGESWHWKNLKGDFGKGYVLEDKEIIKWK